MSVIETDSFAFELPESGERFTEHGVLVWHDANHELMVRVTAAPTDELLSAVATNALKAAEATIADFELAIVARVPSEPTAPTACTFITAAPADKSALFTQGVFRGAAAVMFATLESFAFSSQHVEVWRTFMVSVRQRNIS